MSATRGLGSPKDIAVGLALAAAGGAVSAAMQRAARLGANVTNAALDRAEAAAIRKISGDASPTVAGPVSAGPPAPLELHAMHPARCCCCRRR